MCSFQGKVNPDSCLIPALGKSSKGGGGEMCWAQEELVSAGQVQWRSEVSAGLPAKYSAAASPLGSDGGLGAGGLG